MPQPPEGLSEEYLVPRDAYRQVAAERDALRELVEDLKLGAECYLTAVADLQAGYTPDTHPDWNAVQYLAGEAHAAILRANDMLGVDTALEVEHE